MEVLTPWQILVLVVGGILALAGFINTIGTSVEKISKAVKAAKAPHDELSEDVHKLLEWKKDVDRKLGNDQTALKTLHDGNQAIFQALLALLDHGIDGNNIKQMEDAKTNIINNLITK